MGTLYSCILKAINIVGGPQPPDGGGGGDPGGGGGDPPGGGGSDCDIEVTVFYCTYSDSPNCGASTGQNNTTFTKEELVVLGVIDECSDIVTVDSFTKDGVTYFITQPTTCCTTVRYYYCSPIHAANPCDNSQGCTTFIDVSFNSENESNTPDVFVFANKTGYKDPQDCKDANNGCCRDFDAPGDGGGGGGGGSGPIEFCRCEINPNDPQIQTTPISPGGFIKEATFTQVCDGVTPQEAQIGEAENRAIITNWKATVGAGLFCTTVSETGNLYADCMDQGSCGGDCDDMVVVLKCVPNNCPDPDEVETILSDAYSHINEPFNDPAGDLGWTVCPDDNIIVFSPQGGSLAVLISDPNINTNLSIDGGLGSTIDNNSGHITISTTALNNSTGTQTLTVTLTVGGCATEPLTGSVLLQFDPEDLTICDSFESCSFDSNNCGYTSDQDTVAKIQIIQVQPINDIINGSDQIQFDAPPGGEAYLTATGFAENTAWKKCTEDGTSVIDVLTFNDLGEPVNVTSINFDFPSTPGLSFDIHNITTIDKGRKRVELVNMAGDARDAEKNNGFHFTRLTFTDWVGFKFLKLHCRADNAGGEIPDFEYPQPFQCVAPNTNPIAGLNIKQIQNTTEELIFTGTGASCYWVGDPAPHIIMCTNTWTDPDIGQDIENRGTLIIEALDNTGAITKIDSIDIAPQHGITLGDWLFLPIQGDAYRYKAKFWNLPPGIIETNGQGLLKLFLTMTLTNASTTAFHVGVNGVDNTASFNLPSSPPPTGSNCGDSDPTDPGGPGTGETVGLGTKILNFLSGRNSIRNFRASYLTKQLSKASAQKDYLYHLSNRRSSELLFDPVTSNERYAPRRRLPFIPYKPTGRYYNNIFSNIIDYRIHLINKYYNSTDNETDYSESIFSDLTLENIHLSLTKEFRVKVNNLKHADGSPLKNTILQKIKDLIIKDQLSSFDISDIDNMGTLSKKSNPGLVVNPTFTALNEIIKTVNNSKSLNPREYWGSNKERVLRWKTIASDLSKNLPIIESDLSVEQLFVHDTDVIDLALSDGTTSSLPITDFDQINFVYADGNHSILDLDTQIHRSKVMDFEDLTNSFKKIKDTFNIKLTVSSAAVAKIEEDASLSSERSSKYVFKLNTASLTDLDRENSLIRLTSCNYDLITDPVEIEDWVKTKVYPFYNFYIHHTDLFLDHMEKKKQLNVEYKDISFDTFAPSESEDFAVLPRRIPWYIVVIPTDRNDIITSIGTSKLVDYQTRILNFNITSKTSDYKQNFNSPILDEVHSDYYLNTATGDKYFESFTYEYNDSKVKDTLKPFKKGYEILPRPEPATRALFKAIRGVIEDGNEFVERNSNTITWGSVYKRMSKQDKKSIALVDSFNFQDLKSKFLLGKISSNDTINAEFGKIKDSVNSNIKNISKYVPKVAGKLTIEKLVEDSLEEFPGE